MKAKRSTSLPLAFIFGIAQGLLFALITGSTLRSCDSGYVYGFVTNIVVPLLLAVVYMLLIKNERNSKRIGLFSAIDILGFASVVTGRYVLAKHGINNFLIFPTGTLDKGDRMNVLMFEVIFISAILVFKTVVLLFVFTRNITDRIE